METITFVCGIIMCCLGVATFVVSMNQRSKGDGAMLQKLDQAVDGIEDLKKDMKEVKDNQHKSDLKIQSHTDQINALYTLVTNNETMQKSLNTILEYIQMSLSIMRGGTDHEH